MKWSEVKSQLCPTLCNRMDCRLPGSSRGIFQARILEWVAVPYSRRSSQPWHRTQASNPDLLHCRRILYQLNFKGSPRILEWVTYPFSRGSSCPGIKPGSSALQADSLPTELSGIDLNALSKQVIWVLEKYILIQSFITSGTPTFILIVCVCVCVCVCARVCVCSVVSDSLWPHLDWSSPGSSVHGIFQARILKWVAISTPGDLPDPGIEPKLLLLLL